MPSQVMLYARTQCTSRGYSRTESRLTGLFFVITHGYLAKGRQVAYPNCADKEVAVLGVNFAVSVTYNLEVEVRNDD